MGLCSNDVKSSHIAFHEHFNYIVMHFICVLYMLSCCVLLGLDWVEPMMYLSLHVTCSCIFIHTYLHFFRFLYTAVIGTFLTLFLSLSLFLALVCSMAPKRKSTPSQNPLRSRASSSSNPTPSSWGDHQNTPCSGFAKVPRFLNMVMTFILHPLSHYNTITETRT